MHHRSRLWIQTLQLLRMNPLSSLFVIEGRLATDGAKSVYKWVP